MTTHHLKSIKLKATAVGEKIDHLKTPFGWFEIFLMLALGFVLGIVIF